MSWRSIDRVDVRARLDRAAPQLVVLLALALFGWNLWGYDLWAPDEPYFAEGAREMLVDGHWLVPHVNGEITTDKPPLFFWLIAIVSMPFGGVSSLTARLPSLIAGLGSVYLTMRLGTMLFGRSTGWLAGAVLATTTMAWEKSRWSQIDSLLCFLILLALFQFEQFRSGRMPGRRAGLVFWTCLGLAALAKGPVGAIVPLGIAVATLATDRALSRWREFAPRIGPVVFVATVSLWVLPASVWGGEYSVLAALRDHVVERSVHGMHHRQPPWYYLGVLPYALFPWSLLLPGALLDAWRRRTSPGDRFLLVWFLFVILFFSIPTEKRDLYILPSFPAFAILASRLVVTTSARTSGEHPEGEEPLGKRWVTAPQGIVGAIFVLVALAVPVVAPRIDPELRGPAVALAIVAGLGGVCVLAAAWRGFPARSVGWSAATMIAALIVIASVVYPPINARKSGVELGRIVRDETASHRSLGGEVLCYEIENTTRMVNFYGGVYLRQITDPAELIARMSEPSYLLADEGLLPPLPAEISRRLTVLHRTRLGRRDLMFVRIGHAAPPGAARTP